MGIIKKIRFRTHKPKKQDIDAEIDKVIYKKEPQALETIQDQIESPNTSIYCPESIKTENLKDITKHPEQYIEINMVKKIRIVDNFYISADIREFHYKDKEYSINEERIYLLPTKTGYIMPTAFYFETNNDPTSFKQTNKGITGKALTLLYDENLYQDLFSEDVSKYNFIIVILLIINLFAFVGGCFVYFT